MKFLISSVNEPTYAYFNALIYIELLPDKKQEQEQEKDNYN